MAAPAPIPGSAKDDFDRLRMLFLRANDLDQSVFCRVECATNRPGAGWRVHVVASGKEDARTGPCLTVIIAEMVAELSRKLLLRWRSDGGALQLCGVPLAPFDPPEGEVVEMSRGRELPAAHSA